MSIALRMQLDELPTVCWHLLCNLKQWKFSKGAHLAMKVYGTVQLICKRAVQATAAYLQPRMAALLPTTPG